MCSDVQGGSGGECCVMSGGTGDGLRFEARRGGGEARGGSLGGEG